MSARLAIKIYKTKPFRSEQALGLNWPARGFSVRVSGVRHVFVDLVVHRHHAHRHHAVKSGADRSNSPKYLYAGCIERGMQEE
jgi:hypothetical protein